MPGSSKCYNEKQDKQKERGQAGAAVVEKVVSGETMSEQRPK